MGVHIDNQKAMRTARDRLDVCYLCGKPLPLKGTPGWRQKCVGDHVIPRSLLGTAPERMANRWAIELYAHTTCEDRVKDTRDRVAKAIHKIVSTEIPAWRTDDLQVIHSSCSLGQIANGQEQIPVLRDGGAVTEAAWIWQRGMHAALYGTALPQYVNQCIRPPVPGWNRRTQRSVAGELQQARKLEQGILDIVRVAMHFGEVDRITAWGGAVRYTCAWVRPGTFNARTTTCFWALEVPGAIEWSQGVNGRPVPWHGGYETAMPAGASVVTREMIEKSNKRYYFRFALDRIGL